MPQPPTHAPALIGPDTRIPLLDMAVGDRLRQQASLFAERPALMWSAPGTGEVQVMTYTELLESAEAAAAHIEDLAAPGDRVAVWSSNSVAWVVLEYGCALAGTVITAINTGWTDEEAAHALALTKPVAVYVGTDTRGAHLGERATPLCDHVGSRLIELSSIRQPPRRSAGGRTPRSVAPDDPFLIQFTSGTTGRAKGALLSHRAALNGGYVRALVNGADETDVWLNPIPLHHVGGSVTLVLGSMSSGGCYVVMPRFDPRALVAMMRATGATRSGGVPTMWHALLETPGIDEALKSIRSIGLGGASVPPSLVERLQRDYGAAVSVAFAQSECPMITNCDLAGDPVTMATTVGVVAPHTELRIVGEDGRVVARDEVGEVCVRSPLAMMGYFGMPDATAEVFDGDGFLHTGDLGSLDANGVLRINGRRREVIIRGGENVYPIEVEDVLLRHPAVDAVAVLGVASDRWGEEVGAVIRLAPGRSASTGELEAHAAQSVAYFKVPRHWRFVDELPLTASGKIRKVELASLFEASTSP